MPIRRSTRQRHRPGFYQDFIDPNVILSSSSTDQYHKIKRVLGQRKGGSEYLVHIVGEPSQQAFWVKKYMMDRKTREAVEKNPPPEIT